MNYNFPVALEPVFTAKGHQVLNTLAVVRQDNDQPLSSVSNKYRLITHESVVQQAQKFVGSLGASRDEQFHMSANGGRLIYEATYKDRTFAVAKGDVVGARVFIENSYNKTCAVNVRIGFIVLSCLNGMVTSRDAFSLSCRHTGKSDLVFPDPEKLLPVYQAQADRINRLSETPIKRNDVPYLMQDAHGKGAISQIGAERVITTVTALQAPSAWDLMQGLTYHTTHDSGIGSTGRITRLGKIDGWFNTVFRDGGYEAIIAEAQERLGVQ